MSRWMIEKDGTGIEKSGTGIEKSGTGIEKSGTGIEKSGTGIEKSGTGIRRGLLACSMVALVFAGNLHAGNIDPAGSLQLVVQNNKIAVSWIIGDSVFSGISSLDGSYANLLLTEIALTLQFLGTEIAGAGTGKEIAGAGTGKEIAGAGTGTEIAGAGTGTEIAGAGTGTEIAGAGTGSQILIAGAGTGSDAFTITLPQGTGMAMEVSMGCGFATVAVIDSNSVQVVAFDKVSVIGKPEFCGHRFGNDF
jgi:hypothetical protein